MTEFLPVSSTGHLILISHWLGLRGEAVKTFEIVIQAGALLAVVGLYRDRVAEMWRGLFTGQGGGARLVLNVLVSFLPSAVVGLLWHRKIKATLFGLWPVALALFLGGLFMIAIDGWLHANRSRKPLRRTLETVTPWEALLVGLSQCLALWPGTSRSMVTLVTGLMLGWPSKVAAEYSFLLALPTLGAATAFDLIKSGHLLLSSTSALSIVIGCGSAAVVAWLAMRGFIVYLRRRGLAPFGWYRIVLAVIVAVLALR